MLLALALLAQPALEYDFRYALEDGMRGGAYFVTAYLEIPYSTLQFTKHDSGFISRYHVIFQLIDHRKNLYGDERFGEVMLGGGDGRVGTVVETLKVSLPAGKYEGNLKVRMLSASRAVNKDFEVDIFPRALGSVKLTDQHGDFMLSRPFDNSDTLVVETPVQEEGIDSITLAITGPDAQGFKNTIPAPGAQAIWKVSLENFASGTYEARVRAFRQGKETDSRKATFTLRVPFQFDVARYNELVDKLLYVASNEEREKLKSAAPEERQAAWDDFWRTKDPTPQTPYNEAMEEYFAKIEYCDIAFGHGDKGYLSDRARVYMKLGHPDEMEDHPFEPDQYPYIIWRYNTISAEFVFEDQMGFGEYELVYPQGYY